MRTRPPLQVLIMDSATAPVLGADSWVLLQIAANLDRCEHTVHVACDPGTASSYTPVWREVTKLDDAEVVQIRLEPAGSGQSNLTSLRAVLWRASALVRLARYSRRVGIDVIHTNDRPRDALAARLVGWATGARTVVHVHQAHSVWWSRLQRWLVAHADAVVPVSEYVATTLLSSLRLDPERVHVISNAIDPTLCVPREGRAGARADLGLGSTDPVVLTACRLFPEKGVAQLIQSMAVVRDRHPSAKLLIAGRDVTDGAYSRYLREIVAAERLETSVRFLGLRDDIFRLMAAADIFAMPSIGEPFGLVYIEAMAMGLPVVALADGGALEIIDDEDTGLLAAPGDIAGLAARITRLVESPGYARAMGQMGRLSVESRFATAKQAGNVADLYSLLHCAPYRRTKRWGWKGSRARKSMAS